MGEDGNWRAGKRATGRRRRERGSGASCVCLMLTKRLTGDSAASTAGELPIRVCMNGEPDAELWSMCSS